MESIGTDVVRILREEVDKEVTATQFSILEVRFRPHSNKVEAEVALYDAEGNPVSGAVWLVLASTPAEFEAIRQTKFEDVRKLVKGKVQEL